MTNNFFENIDLIIGWKKDQQTIGRQGFGLSLLKIVYPAIFILMMISINDVINFNGRYAEQNRGYQLINVIIILLSSSYITLFIRYFIKLCIMRLHDIKLSSMRIATFMFFPLIPIWLIIFLVYKK